MRGAASMDDVVVAVGEELPRIGSVEPLDARREVPVFVAAPTPQIGPEPSIVHIPPPNRHRGLL